MEITMFLPHQVSRNRLLATALSTALILSTHAAHATGADIPQAPTRPDHVSTQRAIELAAAYFTGRGVTQDEKQAAYWYEKAAEAGDPEAQKQIGYFYEVGLGVPADPARAAHWYQLSAANGLVSAKVNLGVAYLMGIGVPKNPALGERLFVEAAAKGSGLGACYLGEMYFYGAGAKEDQQQARRWYEVGAKLHDPQAEFRLASLLSTDPDRAHNLSKIVDNLRRSASDGYVPAMHALAYLFAAQPSFANSRNETLSLLNKASEAGYWKSSALLGVIAAKGTAGPVDMKSAYYDFRLATLQGGDPANQLLANDLHVLAEKLDHTDVASLDAQAQGYFQQHHETLEFVYKAGENWKRFPAFALATPEAGSYAGKLIPTHDLN
jgi:TPR repeat protein